MLEKILPATKTLSLYLSRTGGVMIVLSAFLVTFEVILRKVFNQSLGGADEISGYAFGAATALSFAQALFDRAHIRVDAAYHLFPRALKIFVNFIGLALLLGFAGIVAFMIWKMVGDTLNHGSRSITPMRIPLAIPQIPWLFGWLFFIFTGVLIGLTALVRLLAKNYSGVDALIGVKSISEHIEEERG